MENKVFIGSLPWSIDSDKLREIFSEAGEITDASVVTDRETGRSRGFGFVEFTSAEAAQNAIKLFNEKEIEGRQIFVNIARPKE